MPDLSELIPGEEAIIERMLTSGQMRKRLKDLGFTDGTEIECVSVSPSGNPKAYLIRGAVIALRCKDCQKIEIKKVLS